MPINIRNGMNKVVKLKIKKVYDNIGLKKERSTDEKFKNCKRYK